MRITLEKNDLVKALSKVQTAVERRNTIPILNNVKLDADEGNKRLLFSATDMDMSIKADIAAKVKEGGAITVPCAMLNDIAKKMDDGAEISLSVENSILHVVSDKSHFQLQTLPADEFPQINEGDMQTEFSIEARQLKEIFERTQFAISLEETRYYLNGIYLHTLSEDNQEFLCAVATDGHRLAKAMVVKPSTLDAIEGIIIPRKAIVEILRLLDDPEEMVTCQLSDNKIRIDSGSAQLISKLIDGNFPDYNRVIPDGNENVVEVKSQAFKRAVDRVATVSSEKMRAVKFTVSDNNIHLNVMSQDHGSAEEDIPATYKGNTIDISFNARYLIDITNQIHTDDLIIRLGDGMLPAIISEPSSDHALYVVMPMRV